MALEYYETQWEIPFESCNEYTSKPKTKKLKGIF